MGLDVFSRKVWPKCCCFFGFFFFSFGRGVYLAQVGMTASPALYKKVLCVLERYVFVFHLENILKAGLYIKT